MFTSLNPNSKPYHELGTSIKDTLGNRPPCCSPWRSVDKHDAGRYTDRRLDEGRRVTLAEVP